MHSHICRRDLGYPHTKSLLWERILKCTHASVFFSPFFLFSNSLSILPSYMCRKGVGGNNVKPKKPKVVKTWDRDIICIPQSRKNKAEGGNYIHPRGKYRAHLASSGLIGKLHLTSEMSDDDVVMEICTVFKT